MTKEAQEWRRLAEGYANLLAVARGARGYLAALPEQYRPDLEWFAPLDEAIAKALGEETQ